MPAENPSREEIETAKAVRAMSESRGFRVFREKLRELEKMRTMVLHDPAKGIEEVQLARGFLQHRAEEDAVLKEFLRIADTPEAAPDEADNVQYR